MSRHVYRLGVGIALVALALAVTDEVIGLAPGVTEANVRRIHAGMSLEEASAIFGGRGHSFGCDVSRGRIGPETWVWFGTDVIVVLRCDLAGKIEAVSWSPIPARWPGRQPSPLGRLRTWLGW